MHPSSPAATALAEIFQPRRQSAGNAPIAAAPPREIDGGLYLFALCKQLQAVSLDRSGIECLLEADRVGKLPEAACRMLGLMVCELVKDAGRCAHRDIARPTITVSLQRRGTTCLCIVSRQGLGDGRGRGEPGLERARRFAAEFHGGCMIRSMPDRGTTAIMFDAYAIEQDFPAALSRFRLDETWRWAARRLPTALS